jgi:hypothetical protein
MKQRLVWHAGLFIGLFTRLYHIRKIGLPRKGGNRAWLATGPTDITRQHLTVGVGMLLWNTWIHEFLARLSRSSEPI